MNREELEELHYITPIANVPSILQRGIVSHHRAAKLEHASVAKADIQDRREGKAVPGGRSLHRYANLYICARNPMMFLRRASAQELCVLQVNTAVLDIPGAVITDRNAAGDYVSFRRAPGGLSIVDRELTFAPYWTDDDQIQYFRRKAAKCAEVLVPDIVPAHFVTGAYVCDETSRAAFEAMDTGLPVTINGDLFFR